MCSGPTVKDSLCSHPGLMKVAFQLSFLGLDRGCSRAVRSQSGVEPLVWYGAEGGKARLAWWWRAGLRLMAGLYSSRV